MFFIFWSVLSLALSLPNCSQPVSFSFRPDLSFFLPLFNSSPLTCPFLSLRPLIPLCWPLRSNLFVLYFSYFYFCFVFRSYSSLSRPTPSLERRFRTLFSFSSDLSAPLFTTFAIFRSLPILVILLQYTSWKIFWINFSLLILNNVYLQHIRSRYFKIF